MLCWSCDFDVRADVVETNSTSEGTNHEQITASKTIDEEEEPDDGDGCFDDAEDTGSKETGVCSCYAD